MNNYANHGYVVPASRLAVMLLPEKRAVFLNLVAENEPLPTSLDDLQEYFDNGTTWAPHVEFFVLPDESESDTLEKGKVYAQFDEADLFVMTPSKFMNALAMDGIVPRDEQWVTWG